MRTINAMCVSDKKYIEYDLGVVVIDPPSVLCVFIRTLQFIQR